MPVYQYDVNSAYPSALRHVPNLQHGEWVESKTVPAMTDFGVYHVRSRAYRSDVPAPLFCRHLNGTVSFPMQVIGWYWAPEIAALDEYERAGLGEYEILEGWLFKPNDIDDKPFHFIEPLYMKRRALKLAGDGAHVGLKLALNSLYGKLAQQVGWRMTDKGLRIPPYHQLEYAGFATSFCRALVLQAAMLDMESVIAFETDALFTTRPLPLKIGSNLGEWEVTEYRSLSYVQSGVYFGTKANGNTLIKSRGIDRGMMDVDSVAKAFTAESAESRTLPTSLTRFVGAGIALAQNWSKWRTWQTVNKRITLEPTGKRIHANCGLEDGSPLRLNVWHETMCPFLAALHSAEYPIEWLNPNPAMTELAELREDEKDYGESEL